MISKQVNPNNKREYFLTLGPNGSKYIERLSELDDVLIEKYFSKIDINALEQMTDTLTKINKVILEENRKILIVMSKNVDEAISRKEEKYYEFHTKYDYDSKFCMWAFSYLRCFRSRYLFGSSFYYYRYVV